jgi:hypothetical protein
MPDLATPRTNNAQNQISSVIIEPFWILMPDSRSWVVSRKVAVRASAGDQGSGGRDQINCHSEAAVANCGDAKGSIATLVSAPQPMQRKTHSSCASWGSTWATCMFSLQRRQVGRSRLLLMCLRWHVRDRGI